MSLIKYWLLCIFSDYGLYFSRHILYCTHMLIMFLNRVKENGKRNCWISKSETLFSLTENLLNNQSNEPLQIIMTNLKNDLFPYVVFSELFIIHNPFVTKIFLRALIFETNIGMNNNALLSNTRRILFIFNFFGEKGKQVNGNYNFAKWKAYLFFSLMH